MNIRFLKIILFSVAILFLLVFIVVWVYLKEIPREPEKPKHSRESDILQEIFKDSFILSLEKEGQYEVEGDTKTETDILGQSIIKKKIINIKLLDVDLNRDGRGEIIALTTLTFIGPVCTSCRDRFYINVFEVENSAYIIKSEHEFRGVDGELFNSDITIEEASLVDINNDAKQEIQIIYKADSYFGLNKKKVAILQQQEAKFKVIWQQIININIDNHSALPEEEKQNYDATFSFKASDNEYPNIVVDKNILKDKGIELVVPRREQLIYKWDTEKQEYYLFKEENIGEEKSGEEKPEL